MVNTDLIIIGAGPGGYETAISAAHEGVQTVLIEATALGGTCLNEGCIPTKCLCRNAEVLDEVRAAAQFGITTGEVHFDLAAAMQRKNEVVETLKTGIRTLLKSPLVTLVEGRAHFVGPHTVAVGEELYAAPHIIIATGSEAKRLPVPGADCEGVVTAREMLSLEKLPQRLCIIGGGVVGLEFASIFHSFGCEVTVVEYAKEVLPAFDRDIAKRLRTTLKKRGITFHVGAAVNGIASAEGKYKITFDAGAKSGEVVADLVLMSVGRAARTAGLDLEVAGIEYNRRGIVVNENMQTNVEGVYAVGDVNGLCPLAHAATAQGKYALRHFLGKDNKPELQLVPAAVFTVPEVATVGLTEEAAIAAGVEYTTRKAFYRANGKSLAMGATDGIVKLLVDKEQQIVGAHIMGAHAADLIHELALAMQSGTSVKQLSALIHAHPSLSEIIHDAVAEE